MEVRGARRFPPTEEEGVPVGGFVIGQLKKNGRSERCSKPEPDSRTFSRQDDRLRDADDEFVRRPDAHSARHVSRLNPRSDGCEGVLVNTDLRRLVEVVDVVAKHSLNELAISTDFY